MLAHTTRIRSRVSTLSILGLGVVAACTSTSSPTRSTSDPATAGTGTARVVHVECQRGPGARGGMGMGMNGGPGNMAGMGPMGGGMSGDMREDMAVIHQLLGGHDRITRKVVELPDGIESWTTSDDPEIAAILPEHVDAMAARMKDGQLIHAFDPLFRRVFGAALEIQVTVEPLPDGVHVIERGTSPLAIAVIRAHAQVVSWFKQNGMAEAHRCHDIAPGT